MLLKENEKLKEEVAKLKDCVKRLTKGQSAFNEMIFHQTISQNGKGLGYALNKAKKKMEEAPHKEKEGPFPYKCLECGETGHSSWKCKKPAPPSKPHLWAVYNKEHYTVYKAKDGAMKAKFMNKKVNNLPKRI
jgi:hypothetical protein